MIIFGWGHQTIKQIGIAFKQLCGHCHNEDYWILTRIMTWFTLFFIPIFPYSIKYFLSCPVCKYGLTLDDKQVDEIKPLAEINQSLVDGEITQEEYQLRIQKLNSGPIESIPAEIKEVEISTVEEERLSYCSNCGKNLDKDIKFCGGCGTKVNSK
jgi:hypothetical protein